MAPPIYIDKNVVFHHARDRLFGENVPWSSIELVGLVMGGEVEACVSPNLVFAFYNHIHYKLRRPVEQGGKGLSWDEAARRARQFTRTTFDAGTWQVVTLDLDELRAAIADDRFDVEDAVEFHSAQKIKAVLVTWNQRHFSGHGVPLKTPKEFLAERRSKRSATAR